MTLQNVHSRLTPTLNHKAATSNQHRLANIYTTKSLIVSTLKITMLAELKKYVGIKQMETEGKWFKTEEATRTKRENAVHPPKISLSPTYRRDFNTNIRPLEPRGPYIGRFIDAISLVNTPHLA